MDKKIYLDGVEVTLEQLEEARKNHSVRIVEDKNKFKIVGHNSGLEHMRKIANQD